MNKILGITAILMTAMFAAGVLAADTTLTLENKNPTTWAIISDGIYATLTFGTVGPKFTGTLTTWGLDGSTEYALIYKPDTSNRFVDWNGNGGVVIATFKGDQTNLAIDKDTGSLPIVGDWNINPDPDYCLNHNGFDSYAHCKGAKIWIVPTDDLTSGTLPLKAWTPSSYLFETDLITYLDGSLPIGYVNVKCTQKSDCPTGQTCVNSACVPISCGISATGVISFGDMVQGTTVQSADTTTVTNTGNVQVNPLISGANWVGSTYPGNSNAWMLVGATIWSLPTPSWNYLTGTPTSIGTLTNNGDIATVYYQLTVPANQPTDTYTQTITFGATC